MVMDSSRRENILYLLPVMLPGLICGAVLVAAPQDSIGMPEILLITLTTGGIAGCLAFASKRLSARPEECKQEVDSLTEFWREVMLPILERK